MRSEEERIAAGRMFGGAFRKAMLEAIRRAGSQKKLSEETGIHQSRISDYVNGQYDFSGIAIGTLIKLFPELDILYFQRVPFAMEDDIGEAVERRMLAMFRRLSADDKVLCFEMMSRMFGGEIQHDGKPHDNGTAS